MIQDAPRRLDADILAELAASSDRADSSPVWPEASLRLAGALGAWTWSIPTELGGQGLDRVAQLERSEELASACLTTAFILSQREAAVRWLLQAGDAVRRRYLPPAALGELFVTVGLSQLTTSGQHRPPSLRVHLVSAAEHGGAYRLDGNIPWVTGGDHAGALVTGGVLEDGRQILLVLPGGLPGESVESPVSLAALAGSRTVRVRCDGVVVDPDLVLAGPGQQLVRSGGGLDTSCLALGLARAAVDFLVRESERRPEVSPGAGRLADALRAARQRLHALARENTSADDPLALRVESTRLVLRATQAALAVAKGTGFVPPHPAQRWARQAQFFLVWSCPQTVAAALLDDLTLMGDLKPLPLTQSGEGAAVESV